jgi:hypothetical protein
LAFLEPRLGLHREKTAPHKSATIISAQGLQAIDSLEICGAKQRWRKNLPLTESNSPGRNNLPDRGDSLRDSFASRGEPPLGQGCFGAIPYGIASLHAAALPLQNKVSEIASFELVAKLDFDFFLGAL